MLPKIVARWMLGLEGGAFDGVADGLDPKRRAKAKKDLAHVRALIAKVEARERPGFVE